MKKNMSIMLVLSILLLSACATVNSQYVASNPEVDITDTYCEIVWVTVEPRTMISTSIVYSTFEEMLLKSTDVVIAQYIGHRPFGQNLIEFEFTVQERILGNAADRIFVYVENAYASVIGNNSTGLTGFDTSDISFELNTTYLLALERLWGVGLVTHEDGFILLNNLIINLDAPGFSTMYNEPLSLHSTAINFNSRSLYSGDVVEFITEHTAGNPPAEDIIRSADINDIINGSPYVLVVEVNEPSRLASQQVSRDWMETDIYFVTVQQVLRGNIEVGERIRMVYLAYTVQTGNQHIIAAKRMSEGSSMFEFTSRNSLFSMEQLDELNQIIGN